jgi:hypothetical protein
MDGSLLDPTPEISVGNNFQSAVKSLYTTVSDGYALFSHGEIASKLDEWNGLVLTQNLKNSIGEDTSIENLEKILDPNFDYTLTLQTSNGESLEFRKSALSEESKNRFDEMAVNRVGEVIKMRQIMQNSPMRNDFGAAKSDFCRGIPTIKMPWNCLRKHNLPAIH